MKILFLALVVLLSGCSDGISEEQAVQNVREVLTIDASKTDEDILEVLQDACNLLDDLGVGLVALTMREQGYSADESRALLSNASALYCPEHLDSVAEIGG